MQQENNPHDFEDFDPHLFLEDAVPIFYDRNNDFMQTSTQNKISKRAILRGLERLSMKGRSIVLPNAVLRGDLGKIVIGKYVLINSGTCLRPPQKFIAQKEAPPGRRNSEAEILPGARRPHDAFLIISNHCQVN